jgi:hypothetical protein
MVSQPVFSLFPQPPPPSSTPSPLSRRCRPPSDCTGRAPAPPAASTAPLLCRSAPPSLCARAVGPHRSRATLLRQNRVPPSTARDPAPSGLVCFKRRRPHLLPASPTRSTRTQPPAPRPSQRALVPAAVTAFLPTVVPALPSRCRGFVCFKRRQPRRRPSPPGHGPPPRRCPAARWRRRDRRSRPHQRCRMYGPCWCCSGFRPCWHYRRLDPCWHGHPRRGHAPGRAPGCQPILACCGQRTRRRPHPLRAWPTGLPGDYRRPDRSSIADPPSQAAPWVLHHSSARCRRDLDFYDTFYRLRAGVYHCRHPGCPGGLEGARTRNDPRSGAGAHIGSHSGCPDGYCLASHHRRPLRSFMRHHRPSQRLPTPLDSTPTTSPPSTRRPLEFTTFGPSCLSFWTRRPPTTLAGEGRSSSPCDSTPSTTTSLTMLPPRRPRPGP